MPGWYVSDKDPQQFQITDGNAGIITMRALSKSTRLEIEKVLVPMFQAVGMHDAFKLGDKVGDRTNFTLTENGETIVGFARLVSCADMNALFIVLANDQAGADELYTKISNGHCRRSDEPVQTWPDPPPGAVIP